MASLLKKFIKSDVSCQLRSLLYKLFVLQLGMIKGSSVAFLLHFSDRRQRPKRRWFHWDPKEGQSYPLSCHSQAVARQLHKFGHQKPRKTGRAGQQLQGSTGAECPTGGETTPPLLPHPSPQKQVWKLRPATVVNSFYFWFCFWTTSFKL